MKTQRIMAVFAVLTAVTAAFAEPAIKTGETIVILADETGGAGDPRGAAVFPLYVESFLFSRYPGLQATFINRSWEGDTARLANMRFERDILPLDPDVVVICLGMNDAAYLPFSQERLDKFEAELTTLVERCRETGARAWLISPPSVEEEHAARVRVTREAVTTIVDLGRISYNATLAKYRDAVRTVATATDSGFVDWYGATLAVRRAAEAHDEPIRLTTDGRLPDNRSQALLASRLLDAWNAEPIRIDIDIDWPGDSVRLKTHASETVRVVPMTVFEDGRRALVLEKLPLPWVALVVPKGLEPDWSAAAMCRIVLRARQAPQRGLLMTSAMSASPTEAFTAADLAEGVDIASSMLIKKAAGLSELNYLMGQKNGYWYFPWRQMELSPPKYRELVKAQQMLLAAYREYAVGYEEILFNSPRTFDLRVILREVTPEYKLPVRGPGRSE